VGRDVVLVGVTPRPGMAWAVHQTQVTAAVEVVVGLGAVLADLLDQLVKGLHPTMEKTNVLGTDHLDLDLAFVVGVDGSCIGHPLGSLHLINAQEVASNPIWFFFCPMGWKHGLLIGEPEPGVEHVLEVQRLAGQEEIQFRLCCLDGGVELGVARVVVPVETKGHGGLSGGV